MAKRVFEKDGGRFTITDGDGHFESYVLSEGYEELPAASEVEGEPVRKACERVREYQASVATARGHDTYHNTQHNLMADLSTITAAYMSADVPLLRQSLAESQAREKQERALRGEAEARNRRWVELAMSHLIGSGTDENRWPPGTDAIDACKDEIERRAGSHVNDRLALKSYRATEAAFYERYRAAGLPEGGYLIDTINVFAELAKLRERVRELEATLPETSAALYNAVMVLGQFNGCSNTQKRCRDARLVVDRLVNRAADVIRPTTDGGA